MSLKTRFLLIYGAGSVFFLFIVTLLVFEQLESAMERQLKQQFQMDTESRINALNDSFAGMTAQFQSAAKVPMFRSMQYHELTLNQAALQNDIRQIELFFLDFLDQKLPITKIHFVNIKHAEIFHVEKTGIKRNLSDMSQNKIVKEILQLGFGEVSIKEQMINHEIKELVWWVPVYISSMESYGVIGFSVDYPSILNMISHISNSDSDFLCLKNAAGKILLNSNNALCDIEDKDLWAVSQRIHFPGMDWTLILSVDPDTFLVEIKQLKRLVFGLIFPLVAMISFLFTYVYSTQIIRSVAQLVDAARTMGRGETLAPIKINRTDELGELAKEMNAAAILIEDNRNKLLEKNNDLDAYSYTLAHDLRSPLRSITSFSQILEMEAEDKLNEEEKDFLQRIINASKRMSNLIDDILELSRISNREVSVRQVSLSEIAANTLRHLSEIDSQRNVKTEIKKDMMVEGDMQLLTLVLENLLGNAWKYTKKKQQSVIYFDTIKKDGATIYRIRDNGVGFDMQYVHKLFKPFQRLHKSDDYEGTGIGLASVKRMIERHEGQIWLESSVDQGTSVYFTLWSLLNTQK